MITTRDATPTLIGLNRVFEQVTPMITKIPCHTCGTELASPIHLEYLLHILKPPQNPAFYA